MVLSQKTVQMMHNNTRPDDAQLTFTTLGWMMWNHMLSTLGCGACMAAYDGSPFAPSPSTIWAIAERFKITILGLSPRYLQTLETGGYVPNKEFDLRHVRQIQLAGSVLKPELYDCESGRELPCAFDSESNAGASIFWRPDAHLSNLLQGCATTFTRTCGSTTVPVERM